ncbi:MAG: hypothetical protein ABL955_08990, partial [Elusimicrobiota bacterium]
VVVAWMIGFGVYFRNRMKKIPHDRPPSVPVNGSTLRVIDPATGQLKNVEVHVSPRAASPSSSPKPSGGSERPAGAPAYDPAFDD